MRRPASETSKIAALLATLDRRAASRSRRQRGGVQGSYVRSSFRGSRAASLVPLWRIRFAALLLPCVSPAGL